jgi:GTP cyclohydrolase II
LASYKAAAPLLFEMGLQEVRLLNNSPDRQNRLARARREVADMLPFREQNIHYRQAKKDRMEHQLLLATRVR